MRRFTAFSDDPPDSRCTEDEANSGEHLSDALLPDGREQAFQLPDEIPGEIRVAVDRLDRLNQGPLSRLIEATNPDQQGL